MKNPSPTFDVWPIAAPYSCRLVAAWSVSRVPARSGQTGPQSQYEVIEMSSLHNPARRWALLALPAATLLAAAGCSPGSSSQDSASEQGSVTVTTTATASSVPTGQQTGDTEPARPADGGFNPTQCNTVRAGQNITGDIHVRSGDTCLLTDLTVIGEIDVHDGGRLEIQNVHVTEDIDAERYAYVRISGGEVTGSIKLERGGEAVVENVRIGDSLESEDNTGPQRFDNNTIGGDLECENNSQAPTGGGNQVSGQREGQCTGL